MIPTRLRGIIVALVGVVTIICLIFGMYCPDYHFQVMRLPLNQGIQFQSSLHRINLSADCLPVWDSAPEAIRQGLGPLLRPMTFLCRTIVRELDGKSIPDAVTTACRPAFSSMLGVVHLDMCDTLQRWGLGSVFLRLGISVAVCLVVAASIIILSWAFFRQTRAVRKTAMLLGFCAPGTLLLALALERLTVGSVSANSLAQFLVGFSDTAEVSSLYVGYISYLTATLVTCAFCGILTAFVDSRHCMDDPNYRRTEREAALWDERNQHLLWSKQEQMDRLAGDNEVMRYLLAVTEEQEKLTKIERAVAKRRS
ncbi:MAG: hypothetical protein KVP17_001441 [Porospora cf. gigantea B]|uniref:uncharacterized protein n=1 Tax=Porospora cf. gigantea B TaxID=2853592 RepID=UPI003571A1BD|nr:MAG: hypothetical protein KVP17_001441 [Porospora cf. gigantea B]